MNFVKKREELGYKNILIVDDFLNDEEIKTALDFYKSNKQEINQWGRSFPVKIKDRLPLLRKKYEDFTGYAIEDWEVNRWPKGGFQLQHYDDGSNITQLSSITYLNEEFEGGQTKFSCGTFVQPKKGRAIFYDGSYFFHGVEEVTSGNRYTIPMWFIEK